MLFEDVDKLRRKFLWPKQPASVAASKLNDTRAKLGCQRFGALVRKAFAARPTTSCDYVSRSNFQRCRIESIVIDAKSVVRQEEVHVGRNLRSRLR